MSPDNLIVHLALLRISLALSSIFFGASVPITTTLFVITEWIFLILFTVSFSIMALNKDLKKTFTQLVSTMKVQSNREINTVELIRYPITLAALIVAGANNSISELSQVVLLFYTAGMCGVHVGTLIFPSSHV